MPVLEEILFVRTSFNLLPVRVPTGKGRNKGILKLCSIQIHFTIELMSCNPLLSTGTTNFKSVFADTRSASKYAMYSTALACPGGGGARGAAPPPPQAGLHSMVLFFEPHNLRKHTLLFSFFLRI